MPLDRNADPAAMAARIKELEAAQAAAPPVSPLDRLWAIAGEVLGLFPKWLLVAALAVFIAYHGYSYFMQSSRMQAENDLAAAQAAETKARANAMTYKPGLLASGAEGASPKSQPRMVATDGGACDESLPTLPKGSEGKIKRDVFTAPPPCVAQVAPDFVEPGSVLPKQAADPYRPPPSSSTK